MAMNCLMLISFHPKFSKFRFTVEGHEAKVKSEFQDQADAIWIAIRGLLRGHNDTPCGRLTPGRPIGRPQGVFGVISNLLVIVFLFLTLSSRSWKSAKARDEAKDLNFSDHVGVAAEFKFKRKTRKRHRRCEGGACAGA
jgi:hypothetical protein